LAPPANQGAVRFRLVDERGEAQFVKVHWRPRLGLRSFRWDEAVEIAGADPDFHLRDLYCRKNALSRLGPSRFVDLSKDAACERKDPFSRALRVERRAPARARRLARAGNRRRMVSTSRFSRFC
jgi:hypothetical protein